MERRGPPRRILLPSLDPEVYPALLSSTTRTPSPTSPSLTPTSPHPTTSPPSSIRPLPTCVHSDHSLPLLSSASLNSIFDLHPRSDHTHPCCPPAPVYVLAPDGSHLYRLDSSKPTAEEPPPYAPFSLYINGSGNGSQRPSTSTATRTLTPRTGPDVPGSPGPSPQSRLLSPRSRQYGTFPRLETEVVRHSWGATMRAIFCGDDADDNNGRGSIALPLSDEQRLFAGEDVRTRRSVWRRYWAPVGSKAYWRPLLHLITMNLPFNLLVWPPLLVGTLAGTVLLVTLPIGAVLWWLTLIIARWAAQEELKMQNRFHGVAGPRPRPIFHRIREVRLVPPTTGRREGGEALGGGGGEGEVEVVWDTRFLNNSWAMFSDHYSYAALAYFLLLKPINILFPTIALVALLPVCVVLTPLLPIYLRASRVYGLGQARVAASNL